MIVIGVDMWKTFLISKDIAPHAGAYKTSALFKAGSDLAKFVAIFVRSSEQFKEAGNEGRKQADGTI